MTHHHDHDCPAAAVEAALEAPTTPEAGLLLHLKLLAAEAIPAGLLTGPDPYPPIPGTDQRVGGVMLEVACPPWLAAEVLRRVADSIEREAARDELLRTLRN
jgi:hypothetical protein